MKKAKLGLFVFLSCLLPLFFSANVQAQEDQGTTQTTTTTTDNGDGSTTIQTTKTIVTPVPAPKEVVATPTGYVSCFTVDAGWFSGVWVPSHRVCQYDKSAQGVVWVDGYWGCTKATSEGVCTNWAWKAGRWEKTLVTY